MFRDVIIEPPGNQTNWGQLLLSNIAMAPFLEKQSIIGRQIRDIGMGL